MISEKVIKRSADIRKSFVGSTPFKHVCIDEFFTDEAAESLLRDFPSFDPSKAIDEYGNVGRKAVHTRLADISPFYAGIYSYLLSAEFLDTMSAITGIENLIADPTMFGGGTHENLHGQELDPHIDFNAIAVGDGVVHRRANLLLYLNKDWNDDWGGAIELHSNPRDPDNNQINAFSPIFNRAVIFETNEISWHGFPRINLPEASQRNNSRKCLSVYLYTKERPAHEIAGNHGTFYVQRPLSKRFVEGYTLTSKDVVEIKSAVRQRDNYIELYQKAEEVTGRRISGLERNFLELLSRIKLPIVGFAKQVGKAVGAVYHDDWVGNQFSVELEALAPLSLLSIGGYITPNSPIGPRNFTITVDGKAYSHTVDKNESFVLEMPLAIGAGSRFKVELACDVNFVPKELHGTDDERRLAYLLNEIRLL